MCVCAHIQLTDTQVVGMEYVSVCTVHNYLVNNLALDYMNHCIPTHLHKQDKALMEDWQQTVTKQPREQRG